MIFVYATIIFIRWDVGKVTVTADFQLNFLMVVLQKWHSV